MLTLAWNIVCPSSCAQMNLFSSSRTFSLRWIVFIRKWAAKYLKILSRASYTTSISNSCANFNGAFLCFLDNFCAVLFISAGYHVFLVLFRRKFSFARIFATSIECCRDVRSKSFVSSVFMSFKISCRRFWRSLLSREFNAIIFFVHYQLVVHQVCIP